MKRFVLDIFRRFFAHSKLQKFNLLLFHLGLRGLGILNYENETVSGELFLRNTILPTIITRDNPIFLDIGANVGNYSVSLLETFPNATIYAFEPHPTSFFSLKTRMPPDRIKCYNLALGEAHGNMTLYDRADQDGSVHASLHEAVISEIHKQGVVKFAVPVESLDDFCEKETITDIDFMKIDTEGSELAILRGAQRLLANNKIKCLHFEFNEMNIVSRVFFRDFRTTLQDFDLYRLLPNGLLSLGDSPVSTEIFAYQNILAVPKGIKNKYCH